MSVKGRGFAVCAVALVGVAVAAVIFSSRGPRPEEARAPATVEAPKVEKEKAGSADAEYVMVGGVRRKASDLRPIKPDLAKVKKIEKNPLDYGRLPGVKPDANPQVKAVAEAIRNKNHPERLSVMARGAAFDPKAYKADPKPYLDAVEPGRVFQTAQPGPGVPHLAPASDRLTRLTQGQTTRLRVQAPAGSPGLVHLV